MGNHADGVPRGMGLSREPVRVSCDSEVVDADVKGGSGDGISCSLAENCACHLPSQEF